MEEARLYRRKGEVCCMLFTAQLWRRNLWEGGGGGVERWGGACSSTCYLGGGGGREEEEGCQCLLETGIGTWGNISWELLSISVYTNLCQVS